MGDTQTMTEQKKRYTILGIFVAMFLFGAFFLRETGVYFDEHSEEEILYMNILQYGETLQISMITNWFQWKDGYRPICESIERDHGVLSVCTVINEAGAASGSGQAAE